MAKMLKRKPTSKLVMDEDINDQMEKFAGGGGGKSSFVGPPRNPQRFPKMKITEQGPITSETRKFHSDQYKIGELLDLHSMEKGRGPQSILTGKKRKNYVER